LLGKGRDTSRALFRWGAATHAEQGALPMTRADLTEKIASIKRRKGLTWKNIAAV
jgi:hypothetical protein